MLFNSFQFALFSPTLLLLYQLCPTAWKRPLLLAASCIFYMAFIPAYILILILLIAVDYAAGILLETTAGGRRRAWMLLSLVANLSILGSFKYWNFAAMNLNESLGISNIPLLALALPIGLSFHTFQSLAYTIEVYRGRWPAERNLWRYALYVLFFPQMVAGPIERPQGLLRQLQEGPQQSVAANAQGLRLMLLGFAKKLVIADRLAPFVNETFDHAGDYLGPRLWLATFFFSIQIYCDFSGYTDIAQGLARLLGYDLCVNFRRPYVALSLSEFWQRWHISLSSWFRDYLYIPLGGNRKGPARRTLNLLITFLLSGFWHGANWTFLLWGALHGVGVAVENLLKPLVRLPAWLGWILTMIWVQICWVFFRAADLKTACYVIWCGAQSGGAMLGGNPQETLINLTLAVALLLYQNAAERTTGENAETLLAARPLVERHCFYVLLVLAILWMGRFSSSEFLYFQF